MRRQRSAQRAERCAVPAVGILRLAGERPQRFRSRGNSLAVFSGYLRILTNHKAFNRFMRPEEALEIIALIRRAPAFVAIEPGPRHWEVFTELCRKADAKGNLVPDAYLAAIAIEHGCEWITVDRGFARYPGLRWRHPLD